MKSLPLQTCQHLGLEPKGNGVGLTLHTLAIRGISSLKTNSYSTDTSVKKKYTLSSPPSTPSRLSRITSAKTKLGS